MPYPSAYTQTYSYTAFQQSGATTRSPARRWTPTWPAFQRPSPGSDVHPDDVALRRGVAERVRDARQALERHSTRDSRSDRLGAAATYVVGQTVTEGATLYIALVAHTSTSSFVTDYGNGLWRTVATFSTSSVAPDNSVDTNALVDRRRHKRQDRQRGRFRGQYRGWRRLRGQVRSQGRHRPDRRRDLVRRVDAAERLPLVRRNGVCPRRVLRGPVRRTDGDFDGDVQFRLRHVDRHERRLDGARCCRGRRRARGFSGRRDYRVADGDDGETVGRGDFELDFDGACAASWRWRRLDDVQRARSAWSIRHCTRRSRWDGGDAAYDAGGHRPQRR